MSFEIRKYGAIDIGSNAIRLLIATVTLYNKEPPVFKKTSLVRVPIRLGQDVFTTGDISQENIFRLVKSMKSFQLLMDVHKVKTYQAYATSAMREAQNGKEVVQQIEKESGIQIDIIDGSHEAAIIAMTDLHASLDASKVFLYVDVGGGSTEFTVFAYGKAVVSKSFKIGTVRLLNDMVNKTLWDQAERWIKEVTAPYEHLDLIGSGGNINNIFKSSGKGVGRPISYFYLVNYYEQLQNYNYEERVYHLNLNHDRADVIIPACRIYLRAMKWSKAKNIYVPKIGLTDGIIKSVFNSDHQII